MIKLEQTCNACPEQYNAYIDDKYIGYLRLRHGSFNVTYIGNEHSVYQSYPQGDGCFASEKERIIELNNACDALIECYNREHGSQKTDENPVPKYEMI